MGLAVGAGALAYMGLRKQWKKGASESETKVKQESEKVPPLENTNGLMPERELQQAASAMNKQLSRTVTDFKDSFDNVKKK